MIDSLFVTLKNSSWRNKERWNCVLILMLYFDRSVSFNDFLLKQLNITQLISDTVLIVTLFPIAFTMDNKHLFFELAEKKNIEICPVFHNSRSAWPKICTVSIPLKFKAFTGMKKNICLLLEIKFTKTNTFFFRFF